MKNIVFSGGGINSLYFLGVIKYLDETNLINDIDNLCGTSAGSIVCLLLLLGFRFNEIYKICKNYNLLNILEIDIFNFTKTYSLYGNHKIKKILNVFIKNKYNVINPSFLKLYNLTKKKLFVIATDVENSSEKIFSVDHTPNVNVCDAICASSAIPFIFPYKEIEESKYIDGAFINNYPINLFMNDLENTIGINIMSHKFNNKKIDSILSYGFNLYELILNSLGSNTVNQLKPGKEIIICKQNLNLNTYLKDIDKIVEDIYNETKKKLE